MADQSQLLDYIDRPSETLSVEYKSWLDLADSNEARADLARHICAMANHGGGAIVFGFTDELDYAGENKYPKVVFNRDLISGIAKRYLEPAPQCEVHIVNSIVGNEHPVVIVPPHGATPICAKAGGPEVNGKPQGIVAGTHYTRKTGPASEPVTSSADWAPIIRRCAMADKASILASISTAIHGATSVAPGTSDKLKAWHAAARKTYLSDIAARPELEQARKAHWQASYAIETSNEQKLKHGDLIEALRQINNEVPDLVRTGWSMFHVFTRPEIAPAFVVDSDFGEEDFLQCAMARDTKPITGTHSDLWRVSADGMATIIRPYWEDDPAYARLGKAVGTFLSPQTQARHIAEVVRHARGLSERFDSPTAVHFRLEWHGLAGREIWHHMGTWLPGFRSSQDHRVVTASIPASDLATQWPDVVAKLGAPVIRLFMTHWAMEPQWVANQQPSWLR